MLNDQLTNNEKPLELENAFNNTGASTAQLSALRSEMQEIKNMLSGVVVTEPQNLNDNIASTTALKLRQSGFSPKVVKRSIVDDFNFIRASDNILFEHGTLSWWAAVLSDAKKVGVYGPWRPWKGAKNKNLSKIPLQNWFQWE